MIEYSVNIDKDKLSEAINYFEFVGGNTSDAVRIGINKAGPRVLSGTSLPTNVSKEIRAEIRVTASFLKEKDASGKPRINFKKASRTVLSGAIQTQSRGLLLSHFDWKPKVSLLGNIFTPDSPIRVRVKPKGAIKDVHGGSDVYGDPFYIRLKNSGKIGIGMWRRSPTPGGSRIKILYGPSVSQVFTEVKDRIMPVASDEYQFQVLDAMRYILAKKYPPEG